MILLCVVFLYGESGIVIGVREFSRENGDEMAAGVNSMVRVYVAQRRKITDGDKVSWQDDMVTRVSFQRFYRWKICRSY